MFNYFNFFQKFNIDLTSGHILRDMPHSAEQEFYDYLNLKFLNNVSCKLIFTDGSKTDNKAGYAINILNHPHSSLILAERINEEVSVAGVEGLAILSALKYIGKNAIKQSVIVSDSYVTLNAINNIGLKTKTNILMAEIKDKLCHLNTLDYSISLIWIPKNVKLKEHIIVDIAAKQSLNAPIIKELDWFWYEDFLDKLDLETDTDMDTFLRQQNKAKKFFNFNLDKFNKKTWFRKVCNYNRATITLLNRLKIGHTKSRYELWQKNIIEDNLCDCQKDTHNINHLFWECEEFELVRLQILSYLDRRNIIKGLDLNTLVNTYSIEIGLKIAQFFISNNIDI